jgi:hypothetical protein
MSGKIDAAVPSRADAPDLREELPAGREYLLGAPWSDDRRRTCIVDIKKRFTRVETNAAPYVDYVAANAYIDTLTSRTIDKSQGVLTFNSIFIAIAAAGGFPLTALLASLSAVLTLLVFMVHWKKEPGELASERGDFEASCRLSMNRSILITVALYLSLISLATLAWESDFYFEATLVLGLT